MVTEDISLERMEDFILQMVVMGDTFPEIMVEMVDTFQETMEDFIRARELAVGLTTMEVVNEIRTMNCRVSILSTFKLQSLLRLMGSFILLL